MGYTQIVTLRFARSSHFGIGFSFSVGFGFGFGFARRPLFFAILCAAVSRNRIRKPKDAREW